jgi:NAD(P) transhydrogenase subunit alpha
MASDQTTDKVLQGNTETASERISIGVLRELWPGETRVSVSPQIAKKYVDLGFVVRIEQGAGLKAGFLDEDYAAFGAEVCKSRDEVLERSKIILLVKAPALDDSAFFAKINRGTLLICFIWPLQNPVLLEKRWII